MPPLPRSSSSSASGPSAVPLVALAGGVGAARFLAGADLALRTARLPVGSLTAIVNTADDTELHGLHISPDIDTVTYTLARAVNPETGWGLVGETWHAMEALARYEPYGAVTWFNLGDRDLATHLFRTARLRAGATLTQVTAEITTAWELAVRLVPMSNDRVRTYVVTPGGRLAFQEYFVQHRHAVPVSEVFFEGATDARPAPDVIEAIHGAGVVVICPSNPIVSIGPMLEVPGIRSAIEARRDRTVAISPIIAGAALKGPADRLLHELGHESSVVGVARLYRDLASVLVIDNADAALADAVRAEGIDVVVTDTIMRDPAVAAELARTCVASVLG